MGTLYSVYTETDYANQAKRNRIEPTNKDLVDPVKVPGTGNRKLQGKVEETVSGFAPLVKDSLVLN